MAAYGQFATVYDALTENIDYRKLAEYYDRVNISHGGKRGILLDLACGTGSISREMKRLGYDVIGVDLSVDMLSIAKEQDCEGIEYLCQDMRSLDMYGTIDTTICVLDSINHLESREDILDCFRSVSLFTDPDGLFLFDVNTVKKHREVLGDNTFVYDTDKAYCVWQNFYSSPEEQDRVDICLDIFEQQEDGAYIRFSEDFSEIALPLDEIAELLCEAGFEIMDIYDYETEQQGDENCEKVLFCCKKKKIKEG